MNENATYTTGLYMIHDAALNQYIMPHVCRTPGEAERDFRVGANDPKSGHLYNSTEQFNLFKVADIDPLTGKVSGMAGPLLVIAGAQVKAGRSEAEKQLKIAGT